MIAEDTVRSIVAMNQQKEKNDTGLIGREVEVLRGVKSLLTSENVPEEVKTSVREILQRNPDIKYKLISMIE